MSLMVIGFGGEKIIVQLKNLKNCIGLQSLISEIL